MKKRSRVWLLLLSAAIFLAVAAVLHLKNSTDFHWLYGRGVINGCAIALGSVPFLVEAGVKKQFPRLAIGGVVAALVVGITAATFPRVSYTQAISLAKETAPELYSFIVTTCVPEHWSRYDPLAGCYLFVTLDEGGREHYLTVDARSGEVTQDDSDYLKEQIEKYKNETGDSPKPVEEESNKSE